MKSKRGQLTLFIILGVIIVLGVLVFFLYKNFINVESNKDSDFLIVNDYYEKCLINLAYEAVSVSSSRGGFIEKYDFYKGSPYMPFSSELNFFSSPIPYWFYVSGNNLFRENVPTKSQIESEIENYILKNIERCDFKDIEERGILADYERPSSIKVRLKNDRLDVSLTQNIRIVKEDKSFSISKKDFSIKTNMGRMYELAKKIYEKQKNENFLESYLMDSLQLYAPTTGVELTCSPLFFNFDEIRKNLSIYFSNNLAYLKIKDKKQNYFDVVINENIPFNVQFMYSPNWPTKIKIYGDNVAQPVGLNAGMGILGFCYVPYHLVYDVAVPVLIQIYDEKELFQFPIIAIIEKNQIKERNYTDNYEGSDIDICKNSIQDFSIKVSDLEGKPIEADVRISCLDNTCYLGRTKIYSGASILNKKVPQCVNAIIEASAEGYSPSSSIVSTNEQNSLEIILKKKHRINLDLGNIRGNAIIIFQGEDYSISLSYPEKTDVDLVEGFYDVKVMVFSNSSLIIPSYTDKRCFEIPSSGLGGLLFDSTKKNCVEVVFPEQKVSNVLIGGGSSVEYLTESNLKNSKKLNIVVPLFQEPRSLDDVSENYIKLEDSAILLEFVR
ncbi:MAG: hypothetical protein QXG18_00255 [Candidatus Pacearchaeota archaeon]